MPYIKTYRGIFDNVQADKDTNELIEQVIRVDISDALSGSTGSGSVVGNVTMGFATATLLFNLAEPTGSVAEIDAAAAFFTNSQGKAIRVSGTPGGVSDGDYIITNNPTVNVGTFLGSYFVTVNAEVNDIRVAGTPGTNGITIEDISEPTIIPLAMADEPLNISILDNDEDKFTPVLSKRAEIKLHTNSAIDINTFCDGEDFRFYVEVFINDRIIFIGWLIVPDMQQEFLPDPNVLILTAVDNLSNIREAPLTLPNGVNPTGKHRLIDYISYCVKKTRVLKNINIINSLRYGHGQLVADAIFTNLDSDRALLTPVTDFFYNGMKLRITGTASNDGDYIVIATGTNIVQITLVERDFVNESASGVLFEDITGVGTFHEIIYLDARTFEDQIDLSIDCLAVLSIIFGEDTRFFQANGEWWALRVDDVEPGDYPVDVFDIDGNFIESKTITKGKSVGKTETMWFMNDDAIIIPDRAFKSVKLTYNYRTPLEIICNIDFSRGALIGADTPTAEEAAKGFTAKKYNLDDWTLTRNWPIPQGSPITADNAVFIRRLLNVVDYEQGRYAVLTPPSVSDVRAPYIYSCPLDVNAKDRFTSSVDFKLPADPGSGGGFYHVMVHVLHGVDDSWWLLNISEANGGQTGDEAEWLDTLGWTTFTGKGEMGLNFVAKDYRDWTTQSYNFEDVPPIPVDGKLYTWLFALNTNGGYDFVDIHYANLNFTFYPFINDGYQKWTGQFHQVSQAAGIAARNKEVKMSDSPRTIFRGAMLVFNGVDFVLALAGFTDHHYATPRPYGEIQAFAVWNQIRTNQRNFDGELDFLDSDKVDAEDLYDGLELFNSLLMMDANRATNDRLFLALRYEHDFYLLTSSVYIVSLYNTVDGKIYTDEHIFKFITG